MHDWRAEVRARLLQLGLTPGDEAEVVEEIAQHMQLSVATIKRRLSAAEARLERAVAERGPQ